MGNSSSHLLSQWFLDVECDRLSSVADRGDMLEIEHRNCVRWAIYIGFNPAQNAISIVHATIPNVDSEHGVLLSPVVLCQPLQKLMDMFPGSRLRVNNRMDKKKEPHAREIIVQRAYRSTEMGYDLAKIDNAGFALWCRYGREDSDCVKCLKCCGKCCSLLWCVICCRCSCLKDSSYRRMESEESHDDSFSV